MISAWHLLWIIPVSNCLSLFLVGMFGTNSQQEQLTDAYNEGLKDGRNAVKNSES